MGRKVFCLVHIMKKAIIILSVLTTVLIATCITLGIFLKESNAKVEKLDLEVYQNLQKLDQLDKQIKSLTDDNKNLQLQIGPKYQLDKDCDKAMKKWSGNTSEGVDIICSFGDKWKDEMNKYYNLLYNELNPDKRKWLVSSQKKWETFTKDNEELEWQTYDQINGGGSIMQTFSSQIYLDRYRDRAIKLMQLYDFLQLEN